MGGAPGVPGWRLGPNGYALRCVRILVTGGHGFIGTHLVPLLLAEGARVRCLVRGEGTPEPLAGLDVEIVRGDLRRADGLAAAVRGVTEVYHLAGLTSSLTPRAMFETNAGGTRRLARASAAAGVDGRFVLCSSLSATGPAARGGVVDEGSACRPISAYGASKVAAEAHVRALMTDLPVTILRPPAVYGPRDTEFLTLFQSAARGISLLAGSPGKRYSFVFAADLARAFVRAARSRAARGQCYFAAHPEVVTLLGLVEAAEVAVGRPTRRLALPESAMRLVGRVADLVSQGSGRSTLLGSERMRELVAGDWVCSPAALMAATGWQPRTPLHEGFSATVAAYRAAGLLPGGVRA